MDPNKKTLKNAFIFYCEKCAFKCCKKSDWNRHISRPKHLNLTNPNEKAQKNAKTTYTCDCNKQYKHMSSLCAHKKKCNYKTQMKDNTEFESECKSETESESECEFETELELENKILSADVIIELVKQNQEFKELILEQNKQMIEQNNKIMELTSKGMNVTNNSNCYNKTKFNLNFFLNEQCKDALNIMDFVNDIQVKLTDLETVGKVGYAEGISRIFINGLKQLDVCKRPIHCSDINPLVAGVFSLLLCRYKRPLSCFMLCERSPLEHRQRHQMLPRNEHRFDPQKVFSLSGQDARKSFGNVACV